MKRYNLESLQLLKLKGLALKMFRVAVESPLFHSILMHRLLRDGGIFKLREKILEETPTYYPLVISDKATQTLITPRDLKFSSHIHEIKTPFHTVRDYAEAYRQGDLSPLDVAKRIFNAVEDSDRRDIPLHAFIAMDRENVLQQAQASEQRLRSGSALSIWDGVPVAVKDEMDQMPYPTTGGTLFLGDKAVKEDSTVVARLRAAGALLIGKANMHEIGINPNGLNIHYGTVHNPYNPNHDPGGSSSGPAACVASNLCPVAVGADGGGSIRIPSALCGLVGLKATFGRVSEKGAAPLCWSVAHIGPIGVGVEDVALAYALMAGPDPADENTQYQPAVSIEGWNVPDLKGIRLGVDRAWFEHASAEVVQVCENTLSALTAAGGEVVEIEISELDEMRIAQAVTILSEMAASMKNYRQHMHTFADSVRLSLALGNDFTAHDFLQAQRMRSRALEIFADIYQNVDAIVSPATAMVSPKIPGDGSRDWSDLTTVTELMRYVFPGNLCGLPAISFPAGYNSQGLPVGMQVMANHWQEALLLKIAHAAELVVERKRPAIYYAILD